MAAVSVEGVIAENAVRTFSERQRDRRLVVADRMVRGLWTRVLFVCRLTRRDA